MNNNRKYLKKIYDKNRRNKMKNGSWKFNTKCPNSLTKEQEEVLIGGLLGDSYLYQYKNQINAGIAISRSIKDLSYLEWQYNLFKDFCSSNIRKFLNKRLNTESWQCSFRTKATKIFSTFRNKWYPNGVKTIPKDLVLTPLIVAIWFCDDGSITYTSKNSRRISLYTDGFLKKDVEFLHSLLLNSLNINFGISRKNKAKDNYGYYLYINSKENILKFVKYIENEFPNCMKRKSERWENYI